ncbi:MAG: heme biosynthesis HemY N-terminal domain-containing protein [Legionella sp.]|nr:heme biosynthesis HemY N-terminal domain-containing protein [Legionella sp.]
MIKIFFILLLLFASVWLGVQLHGDAGYVLVVINHWTLESTLWVALFAIFVLFSVLHLFLLSYRKAADLPAAWQNWRFKHRAERAQNKTTQGLIEFSEGYWKAAKTHLIQALPHTETPLINYLIAARAAQELGNTKLRDDYLREAQQSMPNAKIAVELTQAQLQLAHKQWEQALATLRHLHDLAPKHPYVLKLLAHLYESIEDWPNLIALLPDITRHHALSEEHLSKLTYRAYLGEINHQIAQEAWSALDDRITQLPKALKYNPALITAYARALIQQDENIPAEICLRRALQKNAEAPLLEAYSELPTTTVRLPTIEALLKHHAHSAALHLCLGKIYTTQQLFGKAQTHLEQSLKLKPSAEAYYALGQLFEALKDIPAAFEAYKQGLEQTPRLYSTLTS